MSFILKTVPHDNLQHWIAVNAPGSITNNAGDSWRKYLANNGGTGKTMYDLETSFLAAQGQTSGTTADRWNGYLSAFAGKNPHEKAKNHYR